MNAISSNSFDPQFNLRARHPNFQEYFDRNDALSAQTRHAFTHSLDQPYGDHDLQTVDTIPAPHKNAPIFVFIHGGYWKSLDKRSFHFTARPFLERGCAAAHINYRMAPEISMPDIVADIVASIHWIHEHAEKFNGDPNAIFLAGHSAGGHLALMGTLELEAKRDPVLASIKSILSISGLFDLNPIRNSFLNEELQLDESIVREYSPLTRPTLNLDIPVTFTVGGNETEAFLSQSREMHDRMLANGIPSSYNLLPNLNHFDIVYEISTQNGLIAAPAIEAIPRYT